MKGEEAIRKHAYEFIKSRLADAYPENDGKQTPMRGHPVLLPSTRPRLAAAVALKNGTELKREKN